MVLEKFLKRVVGRTDVVEEALQQLGLLTEDESIKSTKTPANTISENAEVIGGLPHNVNCDMTVDIPRAQHGFCVIIYILTHLSHYGQKQ